MGIARVQYQRYAHGFPGGAGDFRPVCGRRGRKLGAGHMGEVDAAALKKISLFDYPADTAAALGALPGVGVEGAAIKGF